MRWIRFSQQGRTAYGILEGDRIAEVSGDPFAGWERTARKHDLAAVKIEVPVVPPTFYCVGLNYAEHIREVAAKQGIKANLPTQPDVGYRAVNALIAHDEPVVIPRDATKVQYEGELAVVIGKKAKEPERGRGALLRARLHHRQRRQRARLAEVGPHALARQEHRHLQAHGPVDRDRGRSRRARDPRARQRPGDHALSTNAMLFGVATYIATITRYVTLYPGDMIWMGTDGTSPDLKAGDVVEVEITGIGVLRNPFVAA